MDIYSPSKALWHTDKIKLLQEGKQISPTLLQVDLEAYCNDNCNFCSYRKENGYNTKMLDLILPNDLKTKTDINANRPIGIPSPNSGLSQEWAEKLPQQMVEAGIPAIELTGGGEPTIWKYFDELLGNLVKNQREIGLVTNGSNLNDVRIELLSRFGTWVRFSMDASNQLQHQKIHRTPNEDFQRRIDNIRKMVERKEHFESSLTIGISFIINHNNVGDLTNSVLFYKNLGVDNIRFSWMYDKEGHAGLTNDEIMGVKNHLDFLKGSEETEHFKILYQKYRIDTFTQPNTDFDFCYLQKFVWAIGADYKIYPCCIMKYQPNFALGDIREKSLKEWIYDINLVSKQNNLDVTSCFPCWLRDRNISIDSAVKEPPHKNFV